MPQTRTTRARTLPIVLLIALLAAACSGDGGETTSETTDAPEAAATATDAVTDDETTEADVATEDTEDAPTDTDGTQTEEAVGEGGPIAPVAGMDCDEGSEPSGDPIVVGGSLSLTGPLGPTAAIHDAVAEVVTEWVNECGGLLGQPLEWEVLDDQSTPAQASSNYERLLNEGVDLVIGPYGGANILAAAGPVGRAGYIYPTHTNGAPDQEIG